MNALRRRIAAPVRAMLSTTGQRKRAAMIAVAAPLAACFGLGLLLGALGADWGALPLAAVFLAAAGLAVLAARALLGAAQSLRRRQTESWIPEKLRPLTVVVSQDTARRVNIIHPAVDTKHFFGGFIAVFNLARRLSQRGHRVRLITLEPSRLPGDWRERISGYQGLEGVFDRLELVGAERRQPLDVNPGDTIIATHWTAAHVANQAAASIGQRLVYLIQEYEPFIFPMGSAAALARQSYDLPHAAIFSTGLLRDYFTAHRIGVFADGEAAGQRDSVVFDNAITPVGPVSAEELRRPGPRRLLFYGRPEQHATRNLYEIGVMALDAAVAAGHLAGIELAAVGSVEPSGRRFYLPRSGASVEMIPRASQSEYAQMLGSSDLGLALMYTPHPSLVPVEMALAGMVTVTNTFENKDQESLAAISTNLIAAAATVEDIAAAVGAAADRLEDLDARARGSRMSWPLSWDEALNDSVMAGVERLMEPG
jgi:WsaF, C-terminal domain/WsaF, N-terminal domain